VEFHSNYFTEIGSFFSFPDYDMTPIAQNSKSGGLPSSSFVPTLGRDERAFAIDS
jgi:hypothetical protein